MKKQRTAKAASRPLPDTACPSCGTLMEEKKSTLRLPVNGESVAVPRSPHLRCPVCGEIVLRLSDAQHLEERAKALYRQKYRLLSPAEILAIRERHGLTQARLARLLRLGQNTLSRWEAGRNVQTAAMDVLLRLLRDVPESLPYLRRRAA